MTERDWLTVASEPPGLLGAPADMEALAARLASGTASPDDLRAAAAIVLDYAAILRVEVKASCDATARGAIMSTLALFDVAITSASMVGADDFE
jgi:hypothetical protein